MLARIVPGAAALIFLICTTSFAVALILGGGPRATTVELAIYQAFRFEFDLAHASTLALVQVGLGIAAASIAFSLRGAIATGGGLDRAIAVRPPRGRIQAFADYACIALGAGFLILPLGAVVAAGLGGLSDLPASTVPAVIRSLAVALSATALTLALALPMAAAITSARKSGAMVELMGYLVLAISPLVIGTGLFLMLFSWTDPVALALPVTALANTLVALPFAVQAILPQFRETQARFGPLADQLRLTGWPRWRWLILPRLRRPLGFAAGLTAALSVGDLGVIALFADPAAPTLPLMIHQLMGAYRSDAAAGAALVLMVLALGLFWGFDRGGRSDAGA